MIMEHPMSDPDAERSTGPGERSPKRKPSIRQKIRNSFRLSYHAPETNNKRLSVEIPEEGSWIGHKKRKNKAPPSPPLIRRQSIPAVDLSKMKLDVGGDFQMNFNRTPSTGLYSLRSPELATVEMALSEVVKETTPAPSPPAEHVATKYTHAKRPSVVTVPTRGEGGLLSFPGDGHDDDDDNNNSTTHNHAQQKQQQHERPVQPSPMELEDTSGSLFKLSPPVSIQHFEPEVLQTRKSRKWEVKTDNLVRPVSRGTSNMQSANVSKTIEAINRNSFQATGKYGSPVDNVSSSARPSMESNRTQIHTQSGLKKIDSVHGSDASVRTTAGSRRPLGDTNRINNLDTGNRHTVADVDKLLAQRSHVASDQENKRQSFPPLAARRRSLTNMHSGGQVRPRSPTGSISSTTSAMRPRAPSGTITSQRIAWIRELEGNGGKKSPGQEYMHGKLQGGVADRLKQFESHGTNSSSRSSNPGLNNTGTVSKRASFSNSNNNDAYGIEASSARTSRHITTNSDFKRKLEEKLEKKKRDDEEKEKRMSGLSTASKTPQQVIDYVEMGDGDREAGINHLMQNGQNSSEVAHDLDHQARSAFASSRPAESDRQARRQGRIFDHYPSVEDAFQRRNSVQQTKGTDMKGSGAPYGCEGEDSASIQQEPRIAIRGGPVKIVSVMQSAQKAQRAREEEAAAAAAAVANEANSSQVQVRGGPAKPAAVMQSAAAGGRSSSSKANRRSIAAAPAQALVSVPVDDEYDPFNYAVYPSRSSIYSNPAVPPEAYDQQNDGSNSDDSDSESQSGADDMDSNGDAYPEGVVPEIVGGPTKYMSPPEDDAHEEEVVQQPEIRGGPVKYMSPPSEDQCGDEEEVQKPEIRGGPMKYLPSPEDDAQDEEVKKPEIVGGPMKYMSPPEDDAHEEEVVQQPEVRGGPMKYMSPPEDGAQDEEVQKPEIVGGPMKYLPPPSDQESKTVESDGEERQPESQVAVTSAKKEQQPEPPKATGWASRFAVPTAAAKDTPTTTATSTSTSTTAEPAKASGWASRFSSSQPTKSEETAEQVKGSHKVMTRGGPGKIEGVLASANGSVDDSPSPGEKQTADAAAAPLQIRGGPGKIEGVLASANSTVDDSPSPGEKHTADAAAPLQFRGGPGKIEGVLASANNTVDDGPSIGELKQNAAAPLQIRGGPGKVESVLASANSTDDSLSIGEVEQHAAAPLHIRGGPEKIHNILASAGVNMEDPYATADNEEPSTSTSDSSDSSDSVPSFHVRGGPEKIQNVLASAAVDMENPYPQDDEQTNAADQMKIAEIKGGPGKIEGVTQSAAAARAEDKEEQVFKKPEIRGGLGKVEGVTQSAAAARAEDKEEQVFGKPEIRGGPGKVEAVLASAASLPSPLDNDKENASADQMKPVQIRGGPQKPLAVLASAGGAGAGVGRPRSPLSNGTGNSAANGRVKSPLGSPTSPGFTAATLPRFGRA